MWLTTTTRPDVSYTVGVMSRLLHKRPGYIVEIGQQCLKYLHGRAAKKLQYKSGGPIDTFEVMVGASFGPPHEEYRSAQGIMITRGSKPLMRASTRQPFIHPKYSRSRAPGVQWSVSMRRVNGGLLAVLGNGGVEKHMQRAQQICGNARSDARSRWAMDGFALLWFGAGGWWPDKTLAGTRFHSLCQFDWDDGRGRCEYLQGGGAFIIQFLYGIKWFQQSIAGAWWLTALVAMILYRQRYGAGSAPGEQELQPEQGLLPGGDESAEESKSQPENHQKIKSRVWRPQDGQNDRIRTTTKMTNPKKGIWMKRRIHHVHKAEPARQKVQKKILVVMAHRALFRVWGEYAQGFRAEDRAHTCQSHVELSWRPTRKGNIGPTPCLRALRRGQQTDPWGSGGQGHGYQNDQTGQSFIWTIKAINIQLCRVSASCRASTWSSSWRGINLAKVIHMDQVLPLHNQNREATHMKGVASLWQQTGGPLDMMLMEESLITTQLTSRRISGGYHHWVIFGWWIGWRCFSVFIFNGQWASTTRTGGEHRYGLDERRLREEHPWDLPTFQTFPYLQASDQWTHAWFASMERNVPACFILCNEKHWKWNSWESTELQSSSWRTAAGWSKMMNGCLRTRFP